MKEALAAKLKCAVMLAAVLRHTSKSQIACGIVASFIARLLVERSSTLKLYLNRIAQHVTARVYAVTYTSQCKSSAIEFDELQVPKNWSIPGSPRRSSTAGFSSLPSIIELPELAENETVTEVHAETESAALPPTHQQLLLQVQAACARLRE